MSNENPLGFQGKPPTRMTNERPYEPEPDPEHTKAQAKIRAMLDAKLERGEAIAGYRKDGALVRRTKDGDIILKPAR